MSDWPAVTAWSIYSTSHGLQPCLIASNSAGPIYSTIDGLATAMSEWLAVVTWSIYSAGDVSLGSNCSWIYL